MSTPFVSLIINGKARAAVEGATFPVYSPVTGKVIYQAASAGFADVNEALTAAKKSFESWRDSTPLERRNIFLKAAAIIERRMPDFIGSMIKETGAKRSWATFNSKLGLDNVQEAASMATQIKGEILQSNTPGMTVLAFREPVGTILSIGNRTFMKDILEFLRFFSSMECSNNSWAKVDFDADHVRQYCYT